MAPHRRISAEHGSEDKEECGSDRRPCSPPSPPPPASAPSPAAVVATAAFTPPLPLRFPATPIQIDDKNHKLTTVVIIVASALAACFLLLTFFTVLRYRSSRRRRRQAAAAAGLPQTPPDADDDELRVDLLMGAGGEEPYHVWYIRTVGLDEPMIGAISVCSYTRGEGLVEGTDCAVCLGEFADGELLRLLPKCSHAFHIPCIDTWLRSHVNCPLCRAPILAPPRPAPSPPFVADASATAYASATAAADQSDVAAAVGVDSLGAVEEGSEDDGDSAVLPPSHVAVDHPSPRSSFSSEESEIWVTIDLGNGGLGDGAASGTPPEERNGGAELQPVPRSVSMDSSALGGLLLRMRLAGSSMDGRKKPSAGEDASTTKLGTEEGTCKGLSLAEGPHEMERCMSGGRFFLSRLSGKPRNAILPL